MNNFRTGIADYKRVGKIGPITIYKATHYTCTSSDSTTEYKLSPYDTGSWLTYMDTRNPTVDMHTVYLWMIEEGLVATEYPNSVSVTTKTESFSSHTLNTINRKLHQKYPEEQPSLSRTESIWWRTDDV